MLRWLECKNLLWQNPLVLVVLLWRRDSVSTCFSLSLKLERERIHVSLSSLQWHVPARIPPCQKKWAASQAEKIALYSLDY
jgi:hypothetical protein